MESERCGTQEYYGFHLVLNLANFCVDFASIFDPKSWSQTKKLELVPFKLKFREPLYLLGFSEISFVFYLGCPDGLELFYQNFKKFQDVSNC